MNRRELILSAAAASVLPVLIGAIPSARAQSASRGSLRIALGNNLPSSLDPSKVGLLTAIGQGETLMRLTPAMTLEPWLAERVEAVSPTEWRVSLRPGSTFWDGSPVTPQDIETSFRRHWEATPGNTLLLSDKTVFEKEDELNFLMRLPAPQSDFLYILASSEFEIHRMIGAEEAVLTGPYRPVDFVPGSEVLRMVAFDGHWGGPPPNAEIEIRQVIDANARILALQAGDIDMVYGSPPALLDALSDEFAKVIEPTTRIHFLNLNHRRPLFGDKRVREATSRLVNRAMVVEVALNNKGTPLYGILPKTTGLDVVERPIEDSQAATELLDAAGWTMGPDGVRIKDGQRLSFVINTWPNRAELNAIGTVVSGQLAAYGYETSIQEIRDISGHMQGNDWDMATYSNNTMSAGPQRIFLNTLSEGATDNYSGYVNKDLEELIAQYRREPDTAKATALLRQAQEMVLDDHVNIYLLAAPFSIAYNRSKVAHYQFHPSDVFFVNSDTPRAS